MSDSLDEDYEIKIEIQKVLTDINEEMNKLKSELKAVNSVIGENASLPSTVKLVNEKLIIAAKEAGIDLENIGNIENIEDLEDPAEEDSDIPESATNAAIAISTNKLTKKIKQVLK